MNKRKFLSLGWIAVPFLGAFLCGGSVVYADNMNQATNQLRLTNMGSSGEVQTFSVDSSGGGNLTIGPGTGTVGTTRLDLPPGLAGTSSMRIESGVAPTSPVEGDTWNDSTTKGIIVFDDGMKEFRGGVVYSSTGTVITTTTFQGVINLSTITAASSNYNGTITLPANYLVAGKMLRYSALGTLSTAGSANIGIIFAVKLGTTTIGTTGMNTTYPVGLSSMTFSFNGTLGCIAAGSFVLGVSSASTNFTVRVASGTYTVPAGEFVIGNSTMNVAQINTTQANDLNLVAGFSSTSPGNVLVINSIVYEALN